jgi:hypothetical protein
MTTTRGDAELRRLTRLWMDLGYSRREAELAAREDRRVAAIWRSQGMREADVNRALAKLRSMRDLFVVDDQGRLRPAPMGPSIVDVKRQSRT